MRTQSATRDPNDSAPALVLIPPRPLRGRGNQTSRQPAGVPRAARGEDTTTELSTPGITTPVTKPKGNQTPPLSPSEGSTNPLPLASVRSASVPHSNNLAPRRVEGTATTNLPPISVRQGPLPSGNNETKTDPEPNKTGHPEMDPPTETTIHHKHSYPRDRLDDHIERAIRKFRRSASYKAFIEASRGRGDIHPDVGTIRHPAKALLSKFQQEGTPAVMTPPNWNQVRKDQAVERGPHKSARLGIEFLREEFADMMDKEQWTVLPYSLIKQMPNLRLSPLGLVPQRGRRDRMISDYSYFGVNDDTDLSAPKEAMQFGRALQRVLHRIHHANSRYGPVYMSKIDLSDGFYRLWVKPEDTIHLAVLLPQREGEPPLIGIPLTNPMGWVESPPNFCACTETIADLANQRMESQEEWSRARSEPHRLDEVSETPPTGEEGTTDHRMAEWPKQEATQPYRKPLAYWDIYVDDFLGLVQGNKWRRRAVKRLLLRSLDQVFRPLEEGDNPHRQEPASLKKMKKGDATWATRKTILGWEVDSISKTITLPPHRVERLREILGSIRHSQRTIATKDWHKIIGELRSMALALPGTSGLFSLLQEAFRHEEKDRPRLRLSKGVHGFLQDFKDLSDTIVERPTRIAEIIPDRLPATVGACDASGAGMGGVHYLYRKNGKLETVLWRHRFPKWVQDRLVSWENPGGDITNSDLELAGSIAQNDVLARHADVTECTTLNLYDNTATVYWQRKGSTTTVGPAAYLLRLQAMHQRHYRYVPTRDYIPGPENVMADILSRGTLEATPLNKADVFEFDVGTVRKAERAGVSRRYRAKKDKHLQVWNEYCDSENIPPDLNPDYLQRDPMDYLQVFGARYRDGRIAPSGKPVKSRTVEDALRSVGQRFTLLGSPDPTKNHIGKLDYRLKCQLRSYTKEDPPPQRVRPLPVTVVEAALQEAHSGPSEEKKAISNMICVAFYFCLRPGEYTGTTTDDQAFSLDDVTFFVGSRRLDNRTATDEELNGATAVHLHFTTQKNAKKGTVIAHSRSGSDHCCPVTSLLRQVQMHRNHFRSKKLEYDGQTKLASYYEEGQCIPITAKQITGLLRYHATILVSTTGISPLSISARSLRAGGAMALLSADCDASVIKLLARWNSDAMMRYLHQESLPIFRRLAARMYNHGEYNFLPEDEWVPSKGDTPQDEEPEEVEDLLPATPEATPVRQSPVRRYSRRARAERAPYFSPPERRLRFDVRY